MYITLVSDDAKEAPTACLLASVEDEILLEMKLRQQQIFCDRVSWQGNKRKECRDRMLGSRKGV